MLFDCKVQGCSGAKPLAEEVPIEGLIVAFIENHPQRQEDQQEEQKTLDGNLPNVDRRSPRHKSVLEVG